MSKLHPDNAQAHANYGWAALDCGDLATAYAEFQIAQKLTIESKNSEIDICWGLLLSAYSQGDKAFAKQLFDFLKSVDPASVQAAGLKSMGLIYSGAVDQMIEQVIAEFSR
jgi:tetratricopeptide (TPR) repeat protein